MDAQRYRELVTFQRKVETRDPNTGAVLYEWAIVYLDSDTPLSGIPAEVLTGPGREPVLGDAKQAETTARIQLQWFDGVEPTWRILWNGRVFDIVSIELDATARREYRIRCKDGITDGS